MSKELSGLARLADKEKPRENPSKAQPGGRRMTRRLHFVRRSRVVLAGSGVRVSVFSSKIKSRGVDCHHSIQEKWNFTQNGGETRNDFLKSFFSSNSKTAQPMLSRCRERAWRTDSSIRKREKKRPKSGKGARGGFG